SRRRRPRRRPRRARTRDHRGAPHLRAPRRRADGDRRMNIAFYGSSLVSAYWNGAATYYRGLIRNLAELGHAVTFFEPDAYGRQQNHDWKEDPAWARVVVYPSEGLEGVSGVLDRAREFDVVVKASGVGVFDDLLEREV